MPCPHRPPRNRFPRTAVAALLCGASAFAPAVRGQEAGQETARDAMGMSGMYGAYDMTREASGTSWQPESTPMDGMHSVSGAWMTMLHGYATVVYDHQGGPRGNDQSFTTGMLMFMGRRQLTGGALGLRLMVSADPPMGKSGYPLLFQTGETANGRTPLIDRQHPHSLLMEAAGTYSSTLSADSSAFVYLGLAGEPALGPIAFMHRLSGAEIPEAPLTHHWLDSTHVSYGVVSGGYIWRQLKLEASAFNGREPDQYRYNIEVRPLQSYAARLSYNPTSDWSLQASTGHLVSPEQLQPDVNERRTTASASYNAPLGVWWQTTLIWGRNSPSAGRASAGWLLESAAQPVRGQTFFGRIERVAKDELFLPSAALFNDSFTINKLSLGYIHAVMRLQSIDFGVGGLFSVYRFPAALDGAYGAHPTSFMLFVRARL
jgi:hypothetical protein